MQTRPASAQPNGAAALPEVDYTIIVPVYFNEGTVSKTYSLICEKVVAQNPTLSHEFIFIDDGSKDGSYQELMGLKEQDPEHVRIIKFTRNFGQVAGFMAGYHAARGKCIINISADLQDPPHLINDMLAGHFTEGYHLVICTREAREESGYRRITSKFFYNIMKSLSFSNMPEGGFDYALISREVRDVILAQKETNPFWQGQLLWTGYAIKWIPYTRLKREIGKSRWTFSKKVKYMLDGVLSYSFFPLRIISLTGIITALIGFLYTLVVAAQWALGGAPFTGWSPLMIVLLTVSGLQMIMLGIIGEYLWRNLDQTRNRGLFVIEKIV